MGAIFMDGGYDSARVVIEGKYRDKLEHGRNEAINDDPKSHLQEITQKKTKEAPVYVLEKEAGPDHNKTFTVSVSFQGRLLASASAKSKKAAEQKAAAKAVNTF